MADHHGASAAARDERGTWVLAGLYRSSMTAKSTAAHIKAGSPKFTAYLPVGTFEAYAAPAGDAESVWVRYIQGDQPVPVLADTMTVRVRHDGDGPGYDGVGIVTVTVIARCPVCGGPRGWDAVQPFTFHHDGDQYVVDRWRNPCGHTDMYQAVLHESRLRRVPQPAPDLDGAGGQGTDGDEPAPVALVLAAAGKRRSMHAAQAARHLDEHGYSDAAAIVRAEITNRRGHLSAKQAACLLRDLGKPGPSVLAPTVTNLETRA